MASQPSSYYGHSGNRGGRWEPLEEHIRFVMDRAAEFASAFGATDEAKIAALLHDIGKYGDRFQKRLTGDESGVDHWTFGALLARGNFEQYWPRLAETLGCVVAGHHVGLKRPDPPPSFGATAAGAVVANAADGLSAEAEQLGEENPAALVDRFAADGFSLPPLAKSADRRWAGPSVARMLDTRMIFSALVDADFLETEAHFRGDAARPRQPRSDGVPLNVAAAVEELERHLADVRKRKGATPAVRSLRDRLGEDCRAAAEWDRGLYTLTAPTGAGKTLAMLDFALRHAAVHGMRRVVCTIPFLSIIEQTADEYRGIFDKRFGKHFVLEDHSVATHRVVEDGRSGKRDPSEEQNRLLAQNWDAPLVVTTSVGTLQSLFADRPSACRKLHRLANSVLLFDEVQTLPPDLAVVTLAAVSHLVERYGCTAVFATATQPAFSHLHEQVKQYCRRGWEPEEIHVRWRDSFKSAANRTRVEWRTGEPTRWDDLAGELAGPACDQVLCVVNLKRHAADLVERLKAEHGVGDGLFHLSTNLCPAHRRRVLKEVRERLKKKQTCRLVTTQCIEAGVDVDFPAAFRALAPLEAVAQAAGRCNRGGLIERQCPVVVFRPEEDGQVQFPPGYGQGVSVTASEVKRYTAAAAERLIHDPDSIREYYRAFYGLTGKATVKSEWDVPLNASDYETVAGLYRLIRNDTVRVLVPYNPTVFGRLREETENGLPFKQAPRWFAEAALHAVSVFGPRAQAAASLCPVELQIHGGTEPTDWYVLEDPDGTLYDRDRLGLTGLSGSLMY